MIAGNSYLNIQDFLPRRDFATTTGKYNEATGWKGYVINWKKYCNDQAPTC
jgi:hypothetical protein